MTGTKERPILFSGPMVRAILDGRKTQTRRVVKPQPTHRLIEGAGHVTVGMDPVNDGSVWYDADCINPGREVRCPYGRVGDRLWVRETWQSHREGSTRFIRHRADQQFTEVPADAMQWYATDDSDALIDKWCPSIHMPRWASRITLEITDVRVERVQDISKADVRAEGVACSDCWTAGTPYTEFPDDEQCGCLNKFANLWDSINAARGFGWGTNPWVWVVSFKRIDRQDDGRH